MRSFTTKKGIVVHTHLGDYEAAGIVAMTGDRFGRDLATKFRSGQTLSDEQLAWLHKIALENSGRGNQVDVSGVANYAVGSDINLKRVYDFVKGGHHGGHGFPLVRMTMADGRKVTIGLKSGATSANPWQVQVRGHRWQKGAYYGRIDGTGVFYRTMECDDLVVSLLTSMNTNIVEAIAASSKLSGECPLCNNHLNNEQSARRGYSRACAERFCLPWSEEQPVA